MSDYTLDDPFASGGGGAPSVSWLDVPVKTKLVGVVVPPNVDEPTKGYDYVQRTDIQTGAPLYWNSNRSAKDRITDQTHTDGKPNRPVSDPVLTLVTELRDSEFISDRRKEQMAENEQTDDGMRTWYAAGATGQKALKDALAKVKRQAPEVGMTVTVWIEKKTPNDYGGRTNHFEVEVALPNEKTKAVVAKYIEEHAQAAEVDSDDPFNANADITGEPPF